VSGFIIQKQTEIEIFLDPKACKGKCPLDQEQKTKRCLQVPAKILQGLGTMGQIKVKSSLISLSLVQVYILLLVLKQGEQLSYKGILMTPITQT
jgi:hypothetical protein